MTTSESAPGWDELLPQMSVEDQVKIAAMLAWNRFVDALIDHDNVL